ncbi:MAG: hybrid sensor histidine kinase/response regulator [Rhodobiaceae bacterium]|nr:hybrid sensor histidine kinase/response regulator [Rhodobiaceae bacterium]
MDDLLREFLTETNESLDVVDVELVKFEQDPNNEGILGNIFRLVHTIKGTCGFLGLPRLESLAHAAETLMDKYRDGSPVTNDGVTVILHSIDRLKEILGGLEENETEPKGDDSDLIGQLADLSVEAGGGVVEKVADAPAATPEADIDVPTNAGRAVMPGEATLDELERAFQEAEGPELAVPETLQAAEPEVEEKPEVVAAVKADPAAEAPRKESSIANQSIRVNVDTLENLMTMVSELVLTRNQLMEMVRRMDDSEFTVPLQRLSSVTGELQEAVMKTRMQPIGNAWQKLPRIIRDLSKELDKKIDLEMVGADTELDRQVLDLIKDPLTHMVRNSADHGLETTAERIEAGKGDRGKVTLRAYHEGGHIIIEIADDGRGLDAEKIRAKVLSNGLATETELEGMTENQVFRYIFNAGFSTASEVTSVSGRGVGMDVVRTNIELIGGSVDLRSAKGKGTTFTIKIPLTLAIVSALIVESCGERYAIPQLAVVELVRAKSDSEHRIEKINDTPVLRLRDRLLPLVFLDELLHSKRVEDITENAEERIRAQEEAFIVVTRVGEQSFGVVVDSVFDTEEIVVKPAATLLRDISMFSGNTILGDGSVIMIMDPNGIAQTICGELTDSIEASEEGKSNLSDEAETSLLVFRAGTPEPKAVPLSLVTRLEEFEVSQLESSNGMSLVQYRGRLMPIMHVSEGTPLRSEGRQAVLVFTEDDRSVGLAVDEIVDIVTDRLDVELTSEAPGILGSAVIREQATEILDVGHYLTRVFADWFRKPERLLTSASKRLLLVDDSPFFRSMLLPQLSMSGYKVTQAASAEEAWALRDAGEMFDVIISDIEMPGVNGYEFVASLKKDDAWTEIPVIALSAHGTAEDVARGRAAGFDDYVAKFDRDGLIQVLNEMLIQKGEAA